MASANPASAADTESAMAIASTTTYHLRARQVFPIILYSSTKYFPPSNFFIDDL